MKTSKRDKLPYRKAAYAFLIDGNKVIAKNSKTFMTFPGGGIDKGESMEKAVRREILEETGAIINKDLKLVTNVKRDYYPEWPGNVPKKIKRYKEFKGEHVFIFVGTVDKFVKPTSDEGDEWKGSTKSWFIPISKVIKLIEAQQKLQPPEDMAFRASQKGVLGGILYCQTHKNPPIKSPHKKSPP
jgi:8-oxo-dGTP pyrophosphatase MutT (NUDIX family)